MHSLKELITVLHRTTTMKTAVVLILLWTDVGVMTAVSPTNSDRKALTTNRSQNQSIPGVLTVDRETLEPSDQRNCYEHLCFCYARTANCSNTNGRLTFIPAFNLRIFTLHFDNNRLAEIRSETFFTNVTQLRELTMSYNGLRYIHPFALEPLTQLTRLILTGNKLSYPAVVMILSLESLQALNIGNQGNLGNLPDNIFLDNPHPLVNFTTLFINGCSMKTMNLSIFHPLVNFQVLDAHDNRIDSVHVDYLPNLKQLELSANSIRDFPGFCMYNGSSLLPSLQSLSLKDNDISFLPDRICLPALQFLDLARNKMNSLRRYAFSHYNFPALRYLILEYMTSNIINIASYAFSNPSILNISFLSDQIDFTKTVRPDSFVNCSGLQRLDLGHNTFENFTDGQFNQLFASLTSLQFLYMQYCGLTKISVNTFTNLRNLKMLTLYGNQIGNIPDGAFDTLTNLISLNLARIGLSVVRETTFNEAIRTQLTRLDLSDNKFVCSCDIQWFQQWFNTNKTLFSRRNYYKCSDSAHESLTSFFLSEQACLFSRGAYTFTLVTVSMLIFTLTMCAALFRYRWHIRLVLYEAFRGSNFTRRLRFQNNQFLYDVFVSYAGEDLGWVLEYLIPELETKRGLRLCLHQRNFTVGNNIVDNISESVEASKKILMVFSKHFAQSQWCQFELVLCLRHSMEHDDQLVVVCLHDLDTRYLTAAMLAVLKTITYVEWGQEPEARASFWGSLDVALSEIMPASGSNSPNSD